MAFTVDNASIRAAIARLGWGEPAPGILHAFGVRGARPWPDAPQDGQYWLQVTDQALDEWNDTIGLFGTEFALLLGTTDPGAYYTENPLNPGGCAHLVPGWYDYQIGLHKGNPALVQLSTVTIIRDADESGTGDPDEHQETGYFGINIHAGGASDHVGEYSAGCQVIKGGWSSYAWTTFFEAVEEAAQDSYRYWLVEAADLAT